MSSLFNRQIFVDKLAKLNPSQQSIETLSHWCIFHRNNAKELVETWNSEFHCSPLDKHIPFLYLANDILQNSRRKGSEFVNEYWKVLPNALNYVCENGNEDGRKAALRLIDIWEERKVFGSRGQVLKEEVLGRNLDKNYRNGKPNITKPKLGNGDILEKLISSYEQVGDGSVLEDVLFAKYQNSISYLERVEKEIASNPDFGRLNRSGILEEMQTHLDTLEECTNKLAASELSRTTLLSHLREAILEQEGKIEQAHDHIQASESKSEQLNIISNKLQDCKSCRASEQNVKEAPDALLTIIMVFSSLASEKSCSAISTRVSNELGAGHPKAARLAICVVVALAVTEGLIVGATMTLARNLWGHAYSDEDEVVKYVAIMMPILAISNFVDGIQAVLAGTARGCGWQNIGALVNLGAYYIFGIPSAILLAFVFKIGGKGLWMGIISGLFVQLVSYSTITICTDWEKEAKKARERVYSSTLPIDQVF